MDVVEEGLVVDVVEFHCEFLGFEVAEVEFFGRVGFAVGVIVKAGGAGEARLHGKNAGVWTDVECVGIDFVLGAGPDDGHLSGKDVEELRSFVELGFPQECPEGEHAGIAAEGSKTDGPAVDAHGAEFEQGKGPAVLADPDGLVEDGAGGEKLDGNGDENPEGQENKDGENCG